MRILFSALCTGFLVVSVGLTGLAQSAKPVVRPVKTVSPKAKSAIKPAAKPAVKPAVTKPVTRPTPAPTPAATPAPVSTPAPRSAPAYAIPGVGTLQPVNGEVVVNLGIGVGSSYTYGFGSSIKSGLAYSLSAEKVLVTGVGPGRIGVGGLIGYQGFNYSYPSGGYQATFDHFVVLARGIYHYNFDLDPRLDTYGGVSLGLRYVRYRDTYLEQFPGGDQSFGGAAVAAGIFVGARYYLTDAIAGFGELGYDMTYLKFGVSAKF